MFLVRNSSYDLGLSKCWKRIMHQVKIFKTVDNELGDLESQINRWIVETKANVIAIHGNIAPQAGKHGLQGSFSSSDVLVIVLYETTS